MERCREYKQATSTENTRIYQSPYCGFSLELLPNCRGDVIKCPLRLAFSPKIAVKTLLESMAETGDY